MARAAAARSAAVIGCSPGPRRILLARARTSSGAPLVCATRPPSCWSTVVMSLIRGSNRNSARRISSRRPADTSRPHAAASSSRATSVGSPAELPFPASSAVLQANATSASVPRSGDPAPPDRAGSSRLVSPSGVQALVTRIRFWVSVPVLSVQMTEVDPRVSTAESRLTRAPRRAISRTPTASASVIVGSSPSGTFATSSPIAKLIAAARLSPAARPTGRNARPAPTATSAISQAARLTWCSSGLSSRPTRWLSAAIRPSSVPIPVAVTTACASPAVHSLPLNTRSLACSSGTRPSRSSADLMTGTDSPVSVDMSTSTVPLISRASAQTRSPSSISRTSPGTSSRASISCRDPSRSTRARSGRNAASASTARSAWSSCTKEKLALSRITATIATVSRGVPLAQASTAAAASSSASGWVNCRASSPGQRRPPRRTSSFGPDTSSRRAASRPDRPAAEARRSRNSSSSGSSGSACPRSSVAFMVSTRSPRGVP